MTTRSRFTLEDVLAAFDEHLRRTRGLCAGTRRNYTKYVGEFMLAVFPDGAVELTGFEAREVLAFVGGLSGRYQPRTVELAASALRSFFRFLRAEGVREDRLEDAVPMVLSATGRSQSRTGTIPSQRPTPRLPTRPLIMCSYGDRQPT